MEIDADSPALMSPPTSAAYAMELRETDPRAPQPATIKTPLKPHQLAALAKAVQMERTCAVNYEPLPDSFNTNIDIIGPFQVRTNVGILGDIPSYGKTLTALSIVAATPADNIHWESDSTVGYRCMGKSGYTTIQSTRNTPEEMDCFIRSTLIVVPHGPVYCQWRKAVETQTTLRVLFLDNVVSIRRLCPTPEAVVADPFVLKTFFEQYDAVVFKATSIKTFMELYEPPDPELPRHTYLISRPAYTQQERLGSYNTHPSFFRNAMRFPMYAWSRVIIDEAHDIMARVPFFNFKFAWLITATYPSLHRTVFGNSGYKGFIGGIRDTLREERLYFNLVRSCDDFVLQSFHIPTPIEQIHLCSPIRSVAAVHSFLPPQALERVNAGDVSGAIAMMGGKSDTEDNLVELVTRDMQRELNNQQRMRDVLQTLDIPEDQKTARIQTVDREITRLTERMAALRERITQLDNKECEICREPLTNPIFLRCTHVHCAECIVQWLQARNNSTKTCPTCRAPIHLNQLVAVVPRPPASAAVDPAGASTSASASATPPPGPPPTKIDALINILRANPRGRFLVFSRVDMWQIYNRLIQENIHVCELKGTTSQMMNKLKAFEEGAVNVILLNTHYAGSGIEITCATDVVLVHTMGQDAIQAIGRANRVGRKRPLRIHRLLYPHELEVEGPAP